MRLVATMALWLMASSAFAVPVTYVFSGYIDHSEIAGPTEGPYKGLVPPDMGVEVGMSFTGVLNYDAEALGCFLTPGGSRICGSQEATPFWMVSFGNIVLTSTSPDVAVGDSSTRFQFGANQFLPPIFDGWSLLAQSDTYLSLFSDDSLVSFLESGAPSDLSMFQQGVWFENAFIRPASWIADGLMWNVGGTITEFHRVPEPATLGLLGIGFVGVLLARRRRIHGRARHA